MCDIASQVLETAAFACGFGCERTEVSDAEEAFAAGVQFNGPVDGEILIAAPLQLCQLLAANLLSLDESEVEMQHAADCLKELANIVCGRWLTARFGDEPVFRLSVPEVQRLDAQAWSGLADRQSTACLLVEDHPFLAYSAVTSDGSQS
jgi:hypothetical protein